MKRLAITILATGILALSVDAMAAGAGALEGDWISPSGSVIRVFGCGEMVCAKIVAIEPSAPGTVDNNNPDAALRARSLCGLEIGQGFKREDGAHASGGKLYDPKSGKTYSGTMIADGGNLLLRGYVGVALFGRTETWKRAQSTVTACRVS